MNSIRVNTLGIIKQADKLLVLKGIDPASQQVFYRLIGGGVEFGEHSTEALNREIMEEIGTTVENLVFVKVMENVFSYDGKTGHEISFIYEIELGDKDLYTKTEIPNLDKPGSFFAWISISEEVQNKIVLYPAGVIDFLK